MKAPDQPEYEESYTAEPQEGADDDPPVGSSVGPFAMVGPGRWVNARLVVAILPFARSGGVGSEIYLAVTDPDTAQPLLVQSPDSPEAVANHLTNALQDWEMSVGEMRERGRLDVLSEDESEGQEDD